MKTQLSDKQQQAIEHARRAGSEGVRLSAYARAHSLGLRPLYDAPAAWLATPSSLRADAAP